MAPPKKPEADKAKKINFTLSPAMFEAFKQKCLQEGKEISKTLQALIETFLNNDQIPSPVSAHTIEGDDKSLIQSLQARIEKLEQEISRNDNPVINTHSINIESTHDETSITQTQKPAIDVSPVAPIEVSPEPITVNSVPGNEVSGKVTPDEIKIIGRGLIAYKKQKGIKNVKKEMNSFFDYDVTRMKAWSEGNNTKSPGRDKYNMIISKLKEAGIEL